jgi:hypothetical protein
MHLQHAVDAPQRAEGCHAAAGAKREVDRGGRHEAQAQQQPPGDARAQHACVQDARMR